MLLLGPALAGAGPDARLGREQWCYDVIVLSQPCYDLFNEDVSVKQLLYMNIKINGKSLELI